ncbi:HD-GYP domain-containing protein [Thermosipho atlanticus]|uniref:HDIG domain-containing protein n=1 Tax=Thermosipho atlanticus DSM 15807 TaxID=1123380 RepID=A0A1M5TZ19_9BACT|nr:HD domain-containing phosphohydrolase [Thermosipho atlanticus]SHH55901.1 HDIG domain-containing protein [Thermosipho atlanticus DSM 15807]
MVLIFIEWKNRNLDFSNLNFLILILFFVLFEAIGINFQSFVSKKFGNSERTGLFFSTGVIISVLSAAILSPGLAALIPLIGYIFLRINVIFSKNYFYFLFNTSSLGIATYVTSKFLHFSFDFFGNNLYFGILFITFGSIIYFTLNVSFSIIFLFSIYETTSKELVDIVIGEGKFLNAFSTSINTLIIYVLYNYMGIFAIPISLFTLITIQLSNYYANKYRNAKIELLMALIKSIEEKDPYTAGHGEKVAKIASEIASELGFIKREVELLKTAAILHDIGKIGIPDLIILKRGKLSPEEYLIMKEHPKKGYEILKQINEFEDTVAKWVLHHHERWDGKGYPDGLKGEEIPLEARILTIADVYHALISNRPYRDALSREKALNIIEEEAGKIFDPQLVKIFIKLAKEGRI